MSALRSPLARIALTLGLLGLLGLSVFSLSNIVTASWQGDRQDGDFERDGSRARAGTDGEGAGIKSWWRGFRNVDPEVIVPDPAGHERERGGIGEQPAVAAPEHGVVTFEFELGGPQACSERGRATARRRQFELRSIDTDVAGDGEADR